MRIYHPLAARLARRLAPTPITPDMVSASGALAIMLAALAYAQAGWPWGAALGLALHMGWHVLDGADLRAGCCIARLPLGALTIARRLQTIFRQLVIDRLARGLQHRMQPRDIPAAFSQRIVEHSALKIRDNLLKRSLPGDQWGRGASL